MQIQSLYDVYQSLPDSRTASGKRFNQAGVLALITLALIAQQNSLRQITAWVAASDPALGARLGFRFNRVPSYGTIRRVLLDLDLSALRPALAQWMHTLTRTLPVSDARPPALVPLAVDGKTRQCRRTDHTGRSPAQCVCPRFGHHLGASGHPAQHHRSQDACRTAECCAGRGHDHQRRCSLHYARGHSEHPRKRGH
jgi:hypothetical protein